MSGVAQTIVLNAGIKGQPMIAHATADAAITPGYLCEIVSGGDIQKHGTAAVNAQKMFALENLPVGGTIDDDYAIGDHVRYGVFSSGQEVNAVLAASAAAIVDGDALESDGDGTLRVLTTAAATADTARNSVVAFANETVDNSGGGTEVRIKVRVA